MGLTSVTPTSRKMEVVLDASQLAELNLIYAGPTTDGMHMYIDKPAPVAPAAAASSAAGKKKKDAASPSKEGADVIASPPGTAMAWAEKAARKVASIGANPGSGAPHGVRGPEDGPVNPPRSLDDSTPGGLRS